MQPARKQHDLISLFDQVKPTDPTGTGPLRKRFLADLNNRWARLRRLMQDALVTHDIIGLRAPTVQSIAFATVHRPKLSEADKAAAFKTWFDEALRQVVLDGDGSWTAPYIVEAVDQAKLRAKQLLKANASPIVPLSQVQTLKTVAALELKGICDQLSQQAARAIAYAILTRQSRSSAMSVISNRISAIGRTRSAAMAEYVTVKAFSIATLDSFKSFGVRKVGTIPEKIVTGAHGKTLARDAGFDPSQPRDYHGRWAEAGGGSHVVVYHGTSSDVIKGIKKHGIKAAPKGAARTSSNPFLYSGERGKSAYVSTSKEEAKAYAEMRVLNNPGTKNLKPLVVELHVPKSSWKHFQPDVLAGEPVNIGGKEQVSSHRTMKNIPAKWIKNVEEHAAIKSWEEYAHRKDEAPDEDWCPFYMIVCANEEEEFEDAPAFVGPGSRSYYSKRVGAGTIGKIEKATQKLEALKKVDVITAGDNDVCPVCESISKNGPYRINTAMSLIPAHPHCRCAFVPAGTLDDVFDE